MSGLHGSASFLSIPDNSIISLIISVASCLVSSVFAEDFMFASALRIVLHEKVERLALGNLRNPTDRV